MKVTSTKDVLENKKVNIFVYGNAGTKKTLAIATLPNPIIISAEKGLLTLREYDIPVIEVKTLNDVYEACDYIEKSDYDSVAVDSISEIASVLLEEEEDIAKQKAKEKKGIHAEADGRAPYGELLKKITKLVRRLRDLPQHIYVIAKAEKVQMVEGGPKKWGPAFPGAKLGDALCHEFDEIFAARESLTKEGKSITYFQTKSDTEWLARDRSGVLDGKEKQDLSAIIDKILGGAKS